MTAQLSSNTQAVLLLTAPLMTGRALPSPDVLSPGEYKRLARFLMERQKEPADLLGVDSGTLLKECTFLDGTRLARLLERGFQLSQAVERWQSRAIMVMSRADAPYPKRLKDRLREDAPPVLYGCGDISILETGGLAVVGSRQVDAALIEYTEAVGRLAAAARRTIVSGGARGVDQAAMSGALESGGRVAGVMADSLGRAALVREHRNLLMEGQLVLISPYDPAAGFNVGHAMQRNKLIYALADAALVVNADYNKGGTWAGAAEQLDKLRFVPLYVRSDGETGKGLEALRRKGALPWPNPVTPDELVQTLDAPADRFEEFREQVPLSFSGTGEAMPAYRGERKEPPPSASREETMAPSISYPAEFLFAAVKSLAEQMQAAKTEAEIAREWNVSKAQVKAWLKRLIEEGVIEKSGRPVRYRAVSSKAKQVSLFDKGIE
ncbi:MAG TPA: DNA-processing protein DprA [Syntrophales bacterium]|nr:DNA-processing protein DprA [Syntrophales bacterium]